MSYEAIVRQYLQNLNQYIVATTASGEATPELSYRPVLDGFLREVSRLYSPNADIIFEPKLQGHAGRPDWRIYNTDDLGLYGFVEAKALDPSHSINVGMHTEQITKYLSTGYHVILTDGIEFVFFDPANRETEQRYSLIDKPLQCEAIAVTQINLQLDGRLRQFFNSSGFRQCSEEQLVSEIAIRAARLSESVLSLSQAPLGSGFTEEENKNIAILHELQTTLRLHHDPVLEHPKVFADFVAQVLAFGLFYAHRVIADEHGQPKDKYEAIQRFWEDTIYATYTDRLIPFKALVEMLKSELSPSVGSTSQLRCWYDDTRRFLAHVQLRDRQRETPDYHIMYEKFLAKFDPRTRFDFGAFYTPRELASFTVRMASAVIESRFAGRRLYEEGNKIIDPCCGTGTFIEQLVKHSDGGAAVHLIGFEILPAPYALAQYRTAMFEIPNIPNHKIDIFLTNTLSDELVDGSDEHPNSVLRDEIRKARDCAQPPIVLVIGNPPSSDSFGPHTTGANFNKIDELLADFRPSESGRRSRQNTQKQIGNDFMKFLRWAADKVLASEKGVLALVLPSSFAAHPTYRHAREWLISHFAEFWILDFDRDLRTGVRSSSLFDTQQGRMLLIATHTGNVPESMVGRLNCAVITDKTLMQKKEFLTLERSNEGYLSLFTQRDIDGETNAFRPVVAGFDRVVYERFWAIHPAGKEPKENERCVFIRHCSGTKLAPTSLFVHPKQPMLKRRSLEIGDMNYTYGQILTRWFAGQQKPPAEEKLTEDIRTKLRVAAGISDRFRRYAFRPFVSEQLLLDEDVLRLLSGIGGGGTRLRPEVVSAFSVPDTVGIAIAPSPIDIGDDLHRFATFCWDMPDNDLCSRGNAHVFCNSFPAYKTLREEWDPTPRSNINGLLLDRVRELRPETTSTDIVFYTYAVLCSSSLLDAFASAYFTASATENIPRIPFVRNADALTLLIDKGRQLAYLENPGMNHDLSDWVEELKSLFINPFNLNKYEVNDHKGEIRLYAHVKEPVVVLRSIPVELLQLTISGYNVVACWLKFHSYAYTRTEFGLEDYKGLLSLLSALSKQLGLIAEIDIIIGKVISGELELL